MSYNKETGLYEGFIYRITNTVNGKIYIGQTRMTVHKRWMSHKSSSKKVDNPLYRAMRKYGVDKFTVETVFALSSKTKESLKNSLDFCETYCIGKYKTLSNQNGYNLTRGGDSGNINFTNSVDQYDLKLNHIQSFENIKEASVFTGIDEKAIRCNCEESQQTAGCYIWCYSKNKPKKPKYKYEYNIDNVDISKYEPEKLLKLMMMGWNGKRVVQYNVFGEILAVFNDPLDAAEKLGFSSRLTYLYIGGDTRFNMTILLYEGDKFKPIKDSKKPVYMYDIYGNLISKFSCTSEVDDYFGVKRGRIIQSIIYQRLFKGYYFSFDDIFILKPKKYGIALEMLDDNNNIIKSFKSILDVSRFLNKKSIDKKLKKAIEDKTQFEGYYWRYKDEVAVM